MARRNNGLSGLSFSELRREMARRQRSVGTLVRRRERLEDKIAKLNEQISELGGAIGGGGRRGGGARARNSMNLVEALGQLLKGKTMRVTDMTDAVQKAGYVTTSPNFRTIVNQTLTKHKIFKRVGRGQYTVA